jgi:DNA-binding XRE family transcriptional regulator
MVYPVLGYIAEALYHLHDGTARRVSKQIYSSQAKRFRDLLVEYRTRSGVTQAELASRIGRAQTFVSKVELGERRIDLIELLQVLAVLRADPVEFLERLVRRRR